VTVSAGKSSVKFPSHSFDEPDQDFLPFFSMFHGKLNVENSLREITEQTEKTEQTEAACALPAAVFSVCSVISSSYLIVSAGFGSAPTSDTITAIAWQYRAIFTFNRRNHEIHHPDSARRRAFTSRTQRQDRFRAKA
jgi:hypothetical protein